MRIIDRVELNYFRSIYSISFNQCGDVNILVGENDAGKSNALKALNLFFNNETDFGSPYNFLSDLSRVREKEARDAKGKSTVWIKVTFNNYEKWNSLPKKFVVKKTWTRYSQQPELSYPGNRDLPATTVGRFLNKIAFHYIPAVRAREIFSYYLECLHDALLDDERAGILTASDDLVTRINQSTDDLSNRIKERLGFESFIGAPRDLRQLFSALEFSTKFSDFEIPLPKRGDGIQAQHIPLILDFLATTSRKNHVWAYEEPENSLEMGRAFALADQFRQRLSKENQIFLTTHSPAFYSLEGSNIRRWQIYKDTATNLSGTVTASRDLANIAIADEQLGVAALIANRAKDAYQDIKELKAENERLSIIVSASREPQVIVEGPVDEAILKACYRSLYPDDEFFCQFIAAHCAKNVTSFISLANQMAKEEYFPLIGLLDADHEGSKELKRFDNRKKVDGTEFRVVNEPRKIYIGQLPKPYHVAEAESLLKDHTGNAIDLPVTIETCLSPDAITEAMEAEVISFSDIYTDAKSANLAFGLNQSEHLIVALPPRLQYLVQKPDDSKKMQFAEWLAAQIRPEWCEPLVPIFDDLESMC